MLVVTVQSLLILVNRKLTQVSQVAKPIRSRSPGHLIWVPNRPIMISPRYQGMKQRVYWGVKARSRTVAGRGQYVFHWQVGKGYYGAKLDFGHLAKKWLSPDDNYHFWSQKISWPHQ